ncbi:hypothetical protein ACSFC1_00455 [Pseudothermotoga sp. U03pept]|uniref:hypothetical protein n=1 Tax=Pseudothermotoga sp. U03pept TaxID=3447012 RepID=UPI003F0D935E
MIDFCEMIRELNPKIEMVRDEGAMLPEDIDYAETASIIEEDKVEKASPYETLVFVDSRRRTFESINIHGYIALLSQIVTGAVVFENGRCQALFSPNKGPESKLVLAIPHTLAKILDVNGEDVRIGNLVCRVAIGNNAKIALDSFMQELERVHVSKYTNDFLTIKDGSIDFATPSFQVERGPVGLVKNIQKAFVSFEVFKAYSSMRKSQRSKCISTKLVTDNSLLRIMSYLKLVGTSGLRGLVRIETIIEEERFGSTKYQIFETFNRLASTLSVLVDENFFIPRAPEDTLPVIFLERCLDRYFYNPRYIHCSVVEAFGGRETIM